MCDTWVALGDATRGGNAIFGAALAAAQGQNTRIGRMVLGFNGLVAPAALGRADGPGDRDAVFGAAMGAFDDGSLDHGHSCGGFDLDHNNNSFDHVNRMLQLNLPC